MNTDALYSIPLVVISRPHSQSSFLAITIPTVILLFPIEKLIKERDSFREAHLIEKTQTTEPLGINKRDG